MALARCPACNLPFAIVGRAHRCVPRPAPTVQFEDSQAGHASEVPEMGAGDSAGAPAIGAYQSVMCVTQPATGDDRHLHVTANRGEPDHNNVVTMRKAPKRDRAAYMRDYRKLKKAKKNAGGAA
ncbi:hypothetical protein BRDID11004_47920 [Bradyrhizobium diazoefficiens]|uniref:Uncharacterized protein n=1 Tax=Bradyrhizobium diazoefficiens TaxID=1355477 RepID=A0A809ZZQ8_9BRAD|nr:hypothetical protein [Bradyrhizobium diazoefficiens]BBZ94305.1 hypothetical protein F07S3_41380 [Bradyrhizobium diazoefficiens]BCE56393.1 hypothetical protein XF5B_39050 [Bradyrhizobium diazoefficiens]